MVTQVWSMIVSYPRLLSRVGVLETRRTEDLKLQEDQRAADKKLLEEQRTVDRKVIDTLVSSVEAISLASARAQFELAALHTQFAEDRALTREMHKDWQKSQKDLGNAVVKLETTLNLINRTLRNHSNDVD